MEWKGLKLLFHIEKIMGFALICNQLIFLRDLKYVARRSCLTRRGVQEMVGLLDVDREVTFLYFG